MQSAGFWNRSWSIFKQACALPLIGLVKFYQLCISPFTPPSCRFTPTCSQYALEAITKYGALKGGWLALKRLLGEGVSAKDAAKQASALLDVPRNEAYKMAMRIKEGSDD